MDNSKPSRPRRSVLPTAPDMRHLDTVDTCRMRLLALRTRIESDWPSGGRFLRRGHSLSPASETIISDLLVGLPTPLPMVAGGSPETIFGLDDTDLCCIAGRAVDAALVLLEASNLDATYNGQVSLLESHRPGSRQPIVLTDPTVGLLVATIIGTLEAISEKVTRATATTRQAAVASGPEPAQPAPTDQPAHVRRGPGVPRI